MNIKEKNKASSTKKIQPSRVFVTDRQKGSKNQYPTRHVFVKHGCTRQQQSQNMAKISKSFILTLPHPQRHVMSVKCEEPIDELTVQVWLLYYHPNFKYGTLFVSGTELRTDGQTNRQTDGQTDDPITKKNVLHISWKQEGLDIKSS